MVSVIRGCSFSGENPGASEIKSCIPPIPRNGSTVIDIKMMTIPPSHCVVALQNNNPFGRDSTLVNMVAPVVVKPDIDSKNASVKLPVTPLSMYGRAPNKEIEIQEMVNIRYPSRLPMALRKGTRFDIQKKSPRNEVNKPETKSGRKSWFGLKRPDSSIEYGSNQAEKPRQPSMKRPSITNNKPVTLRITLRLTLFELDIYPIRICLV